MTAGERISDSLRVASFLTRAGVQFSKVLLGAATKRRVFTGPLWAQISISDVCNYRCIMCWDHPAKPEEIHRVTGVPRDELKSREACLPQYTNTIMTMETFRDAVDGLTGMGTAKIDIIGHGEPLLNPRVLEMVAYVKSKNILCALITNGSKLDHRIASGLVEAGLDKLIISLNTARPETYPLIHVTAKASSFSKIVDEIDFLVQEKRRHPRANLKVTLSFILSRLNFGEVEEMVSLSTRLGVDKALFRVAETGTHMSYLDLTPEEMGDLQGNLRAAGRQAEEMGLDTNLHVILNSQTQEIGYGGGEEKRARAYTQVPCTIGWYFTMILADGTVNPCCECTMKVGDLKTQSFREIWRSEAYRAFRRTSVGFPQGTSIPQGCRCTMCGFIPHNLTIHSLLHPFRTERASLPFRPRDLLHFLKRR